MLLGAARALLLVGCVLVTAGALTGGADAAYGALAGLAMALLVLGLGTLTVHLVAGALPRASVLVALLTYTLEVVAMAVVLVWLDGSGLLEGTWDRAWLAAGLIAGTCGWLLAQIVLAAKSRIPIYDLVQPARPGPATRVHGDPT